MSPEVFTQDGKRWECKLIEDLSEWLLAPEQGGDIELESLSLWKRLKEEPLEKELPKKGWLGIEVQATMTEGNLGQLNRIDFGIDDGSGLHHIVSLSSPWPVKDDSIVVAKHVRNRERL